MLVSSKEKNCNELVAELMSRGIAAERYNLELCDLAFVKDGKTYVHAELKKIKDFIASIGSDCRYYEQTASMQEAGVPYTFYLIEGMMYPAYVTAEEKKAMQHAATHIQMTGSPKKETNNSHIGVVYLSTSVVDWVAYVFKNLVEDPALSDSIFAPLSQNVRHNYGSKPSARDQHRVYVEQVSRFTGISETKARLVAQHFPSMSRLVEFLRTAEDACSIVKRLQDLKVGLGPKAAEALYTQLLAEEERPFVFELLGKKRKRQVSAGTV